MSSICKSCGAPASDSASLVSFVCDYCGSKNVNPEYLKQYASKIDLAKANHNLQLAIVAINGGDFINAEKHLEASVLEDANNAESWIYLALSKAALIKPSNYEKYYNSAIQCINKAKSIDSSSEIYINGSILVQAKLLETSIIGAGYYIDTAYKKHLAFSGTNGALKNAADEAMKGFILIDNANKLSINNNELSVKAIVYACANCLKFKNEIGSVNQINDQYDKLIQQLNIINQKRKDLVENELNLYANQKAEISKSLKKLNPPVKQNIPDVNSQSDSANSSSSGINKNILIIVIGVVIISIAFFAFNNSKKNESVTSNLAPQPPPNVPIAKVENPTTETTPQTNESNQQAVVLTCSVIEECLRKSLIAASSEDVESIRKIATFIDQFPKPDQGNRPISRKLNTEALEYLKKNDFDAAVNTLKLALKENPKDVEINSNLGFALVKGGRYKEAVSVLTGSLVLDPRRTSTWTPLAEAYALDNKPNEAIAAMWVGLQWSADREKSISYYSDRMEKEKNDRQQLFDLYKSIYNWANGSKPDIKF